MAADIFKPSFSELISYIGASQQQTSHAHDIDLALGNALGCQFWVIEFTRTNDRDIDIFLNDLDIFQVERLGHVHWKMRQILGVIGTIVAAQHIVSAFD